MRRAKSCRTMLRAMMENSCSGYMRMKNYNMVGKPMDILVKRQAYTTKGRVVDPSTLKELITNVTLDTLLVLDKIELNKIFALENIYYNFNKADIRDDAAKELDKLVQLLNDNPEIKIELGSHTDSVDDRCV